jgi:hypothetical protein
VGGVCAGIAGGVWLVHGVGAAEGWLTHGVCAADGAAAQNTVAAAIEANVILIDVSMIQCRVSQLELRVQQPDDSRAARRRELDLARFVGAVDGRGGGLDRRLLADADASQVFPFVDHRQGERRGGRDQRRTPQGQQAR